MKWAVIALLLPCFSVMSQAGSNSESNSFSSGANINNQTVVSESDSLIIGDVKCPKPSLSIIGGSSFVDNGINVDQYNIAMAINIPLVTNDCNSAVKLKLKIIELALKKERETHAIKLASSCAELKQKNIKVDICT